MFPHANASARPSRPRTWVLGAALLLALAGTAQAGPGAGAAEGKARVDGAPVAIGGYDAVSYFDGEVENPPQKGSKDYTHKWNGRTWLFASERHRDRFAKDPEEYTPQYDGYSVLEMARGEAVRGDPKISSVVYGKLYFHSSHKARDKWLNAIIESIYTADLSWKQIQSEAAAAATPAEKTAPAHPVKTAPAKAVAPVPAKPAKPEPAQAARPVPAPEAKPTVPN